MTKLTFYKDGKLFENQIFANSFTNCILQVLIFVINLKIAKFAKFGTNKNCTQSTNGGYIERTVTVTGQCFTISIVNCLPPLRTKHLLIRYIYNHFFLQLLRGYTYGESFSQKLTKK